MKYVMNFGTLATRPIRAKGADDSFRIAVLGDFSGRANSQRMETGGAFVARKPYRVDIDNFDSVLSKVSPRLRLPLAADGGSIDVSIRAMEDFHPDQLYQSVEIFGALAALRKRLKTPATFAEAAKEIQSWPNASAPSEAPRTLTDSRGATIPVGKLDDFARLIGRRPSAARSSTIDELLKQIVGPHVVPAPNPQQPAVLAAVDDALAAAMRRVLHHPDFQALESIWRSVELLTRSLETDGSLQILLYDVSAEELAADLSSAQSLEETGLYQLLVSQPLLAGPHNPLSVILGAYVFDLIPPHAELLGRISKIASLAQAPFIAGISSDCLRQFKEDEIQPLVEESWNALRGMPQSQYVGLTVPRFMLRWPYGKKTEPIDSFAFDEFTPQTGLKGMLWANGCFLVGLLLGKTYSEQGLAGMQLGSATVLDDVPFFYYTDENDDQIALPCTERWISESTALLAKSRHFMPVLSIRERPQIRLASFGSLHGPELAGPWAPIEIPPEESPSASASLEAETTSEPEAQNIPADSHEPEAPRLDTDDLDALLASYAVNETAELPDQETIDPALAEMLKDL